MKLSLLRIFALILPVMATTGCGSSPDTSGAENIAKPQENPEPPPMGAPMKEGTTAPGK